MAACRSSPIRCTIAKSWSPPAADDAGYAAWQAAGGLATPIANEAELAAVLAAQAPDALLTDWRPVPASITRWQAAAELLSRGKITAAEALAMAMAQTAEPPAALADMMDALGEPDASAARLSFAAYNYLRSSPLLVAMFAANDIDVDDFFRSAGARESA